MRSHTRRGGPVFPTQLIERLESRVLFDAAGLFGEYFSGTNFGTLLLARNEAVNFDWKQSAPAPQVPADNFSVRWTGRVLPRYSETYTFSVAADDGVRLWVDGQQLVSDWTPHAVREKSGTISLQAGREYNVRLDYFERTGSAAAKLAWRSARQAKEVIPAAQLRSNMTAATLGASGLYGQYFSGGNFDELKVSRTDAAVSFNWRTGAPAVGVPADNFSVRWTGQVRPTTTGVYTFYTGSDDGVRLWVDDRLVINNWTLHSTREDKGTVSLVAGRQYDIRLEYFEATGDSAISLQWSAAGVAKTAVPATALSPVLSEQRLISWMTIGGSTSNSPATRNIYPSFVTTGWNGVAESVKAQAEAGVTRVVLHNPFGVMPGEPMQLAQYLEAKASGLTWLTDDFVSVWRPVTASGIEVVGYLGMPVDSTFSELERSGNASQWRARFDASVQPLVDAGMSVAFDAAVEFSDKGLLFQAVTALAARGVKVYIEGRPYLVNPGWAAFPVMLIEGGYRRQNPVYFADAAVLYVPNTAFKSEVIRIVTGEASKPPGWGLETTRLILRDGMTAAIPAYKFVREDVDLLDLLR